MRNVILKTVDKKLHNGLIWHLYMELFPKVSLEICSYWSKQKGFWKMIMAMIDDPLNNFIDLKNPYNKNLLLQV